MKTLVSLKIGRNGYEITENDRFLDNGACVMIVTQRAPNRGWRSFNPVMTKKALREISAFERVSRPSRFGEGCTVFSLRKQE